MQIATKKGRWLIFTSKFEPNDLISFTKVDIYDTTYGKHGNDNFDKSYSYTYKYFPNNIAEMYFEGNIYNYFLLKKDNELYETYKLEYFSNLTNENIHDVNNTTKKVIDINDPNYKIFEYTTSQGIYTVYLRKK